MSLVCAECNRAMGPSDNLPGQDGVMVSPVLLSLVWSTAEGEELRWTLAHVRAEDYRSLCFRCIGAKMPVNRKPLLPLIYEAIEAETLYSKLKIEQRGKWIPFEDDRSGDLFRDFKAKIGRLDRETCLICGEKARRSNRPFFIGAALDRAYCCQHTGGFPGEQNYQISDHLPHGMTSFAFWFECLQHCFPRVARLMSCDLQGLDPLPEDLSEATMIVTEEVAEALREELGTQEAEAQLRRVNAKIIGPAQN
jgi:hypothetical protein